MFTTILVALLSPEPAYFVVDVASRTPVVIKINGQVIQNRKIYKTEPILFEKAVITLQFVDGDRIVVRSFNIELIGGEKTTFGVVVNAVATERLCLTVPKRLNAKI